MYIDYWLYGMMYIVQCMINKKILLDHHYNNMQRYFRCHIWPSAYNTYKINNLTHIQKIIQDTLYNVPDPMFVKEQIEH